MDIGNTYSDLLFLCHIYFLFLYRWGLVKINIKVESLVKKYTDRQLYVTRISGPYGPTSLTRGFAMPDLMMGLRPLSCLTTKILFGAECMCQRANDMNFTLCCIFSLSQAFRIKGLLLCSEILRGLLIHINIWILTQNKICAEWRV